MYNAIITRLRAVREHPNADRLKLATCWGSQVIVGLENEEGDLGVYFPTDGQLSEIFTKMNNLYRRNEMNHDKSKSGYISEKRRVRTQKLRDEVGDGLWLPIDCLEFTGKEDIYEDWDHGHEFKKVGDIPICKKYVNPNTKQAQQNRQQQKKKEAKISSKMFKQHFSTKHLARKLGAVDLDREVVITEKVHGTSGRTGRIQLSGGQKSWKDKIANYFGYQKKPVWAYVNGSRRVDFFPDKLESMREKEDKSASEQFQEVSYEDKKLLIKEFSGVDEDARMFRDVFAEMSTMEPQEISLNYVEGKFPGFGTWYQAKAGSSNPWHDPTLRELAGAQFDEFLHKGETVYYEIAGFEPNGSHIMPGGDMKQLGEEFVDKYGDSIQWSYGCGPTEHSVWVYRMTMANEDGKVAEYSWNEVKRRCKEMGVNHVPELWTGSLAELAGHGGKDKETLEMISDSLYDQIIKEIERLSKGESTITPSHLKEGVCVRQGTNIYKHKSVEFKILEGIIKDSDVVDTEEAS